MGGRKAHNQLVSHSARLEAQAPRFKILVCLLFPKVLVTTGRASNKGHNQEPQVRDFKMGVATTPNHSYQKLKNVTVIWPPVALTTIGQAPRVPSLVLETPDEGRHWPGLLLPGTPLACACSHQALLPRVLGGPMLWGAAPGLQGRTG